MIKAIEELHGWDKNPREINEDEYENLKKELDLGMYKPLLTMKDGTVLGGNMRLRAYKDVGIKNVWVSELEIKEEKGNWACYVNGERANKTFTSKNEAMVSYALSDNNRSGYYVTEGLAKILNELPATDFSLFRVDLLPGIKLDALPTFTIGNDATEGDFEKYLQENDGKELLKLLTTKEAAEIIKQKITANKLEEEDDGQTIARLLS